MGNGNDSSAEKPNNPDALAAAIKRRADEAGLGNEKKSIQEQRFGANGEPLHVETKNPNAIAFEDEELTVEDIEQLILKNPKIQEFLKTHPDDGKVHAGALEIFKEAHAELEQNVKNAKSNLDRKEMIPKARKLDIQSLLDTLYRSFVALEKMEPESKKPTPASEMVKTVNVEEKIKKLEGVVAFNSEKERSDVLSSLSEVFYGMRVLEKSGHIPDFKDFRNDYTAFHDAVLLSKNKPEDLKKIEETFVRMQAHIAKAKARVAQNPEVQIPVAPLPKVETAPVKIPVTAPVLKPETAPVIQNTIVSEPLNIELKPKPETVSVPALTMGDNITIRGTHSAPEVLSTSDSFIIKGSEVKPAIPVSPNELSMSDTFTIKGSEQPVVAPTNAAEAIAHIELVKAAEIPAVVPAPDMLINNLKSAISGEPTPEVPEENGFGKLKVDLLETDKANKTASKSYYDKVSFSTTVEDIKKAGRALGRVLGIGQVPSELQANNEAYDIAVQKFRMGFQQRFENRLQKSGVPQDQVAQKLAMFRYRFAEKYAIGHEKEMREIKANSLRETLKTPSMLTVAWLARHPKLFKIAIATSIVSSAFATGGTSLIAIGMGALAKKGIEKVYEKDLSDAEDASKVALSLAYQSDDMAASLRNIRETAESQEVLKSREAFTKYVAAVSTGAVAGGLAHAAGLSVDLDSLISTPANASVPSAEVLAQSTPTHDVLGSAPLGDMSGAEAHRTLAEAKLALMGGGETPQVLTTASSPVSVESITDTVQPDTHTVQKGDTLWQVAAKDTDLTDKELVEGFNKLAESKELRDSVGLVRDNIDIIKPGEVINTDALKQVFTPDIPQPSEEALIHEVVPDEAVTPVPEVPDTVVATDIPAGDADHAPVLTRMPASHEVVNPVPSDMAKHELYPISRAEPQTLSTQLKEVLDTTAAHAVIGGAVNMLPEADRKGLDVDPKRLKRVMQHFEKIIEEHNGKRLSSSMLKFADSESVLDKIYDMPQTEFRRISILPPVELSRTLANMRINETHFKNWRNYFSNLPPGKLKEDKTMGQNLELAAREAIAAGLVNT